MSLLVEWEDGKQYHTLPVALCNNDSIFSREGIGRKALNIPFPNNGWITQEISKCIVWSAWNGEFPDLKNVISEIQNYQLNKYL